MYTSVKPLLLFLDQIRFAVVGYLGAVLSVLLETLPIDHIASMACVNAP